MTETTTTPTNIDLQPLLAYWQRELYLQDWDIHIAIKRQHQMSDSQRTGECSFREAKKSAIISILDVCDYPTCTADTDWPQDQELTVVHELLHLHLAFIKEGSIPEEQAVHAISRTLVRLKRSVQSVQSVQGANITQVMAMDADSFTEFIQQHPNAGSTPPQQPSAYAQPFAHAPIHIRNNH